MSSADRPEDLPLQAGAAAPDLTMDYWKKGAGADSAGDAGAEKQPSQSVFSARSGIQDPLVKTGGEPEEATSGEGFASTEPEGEETAPQAPAHKRRKQKGQPRVVKSRRQLDRARRRQMNYLQRRREQKKMRVFYNRIRLVFKLCFALLWMVLLWELMHSALWMYKPAQFKLENRQLLQNAQLAPLVQPLSGRPIYAIDTGKLARRIEERFDIVDRAVVRRRMFPARLDIQVMEKTPWAEVYADDKQAGPYGLLVPGGIISLVEYRYQPALYTNNGVEKVLAAPHTTFKLSYLDRLREIAWQARQLKGLSLLSVDVRNPQVVVLNFQEIPVILGRLDHNAAERLVRIVPLLPKIREFRDGIESVDLRWENQATFHQKPNAKLNLPQNEPMQG